MGKGWFNIWSALTITLALLEAPLEAQFLYVANVGDSVSGYTIDPLSGTLKAVAGSPFAAGVAPASPETIPIETKVLKEPAKPRGHEEKSS